MNELHLTAPKAWKELSEKQLKYVSWLMTNRQLTSAEIKTFAFIRFTGIEVKHQEAGYWLCMFKGRYFTVSPEQVTSFLRQFDYLTAGIKEINPLNEIAGFTHIDSRLYNTPFGQYLACENYYQAFIFTKKREYLERLAACFYTDNDGFDDGLTEQRRLNFSRIPEHILFTVFLWYSGLKSVFQEHFPHFFRKLDPIIESEPQAPNMRVQIDCMLRALTGGDITKTESVYSAKTWAALSELNAKAKENEEIEKRMKTHKTK